MQYTFGAYVFDTQQYDLQHALEVARSQLIPVCGVCTGRMYALYRPDGSV